MNYAIVTTAQDGQVSIAGPFTSEARARLYGDRSEDLHGGSSDVYEMDTPREFAAFSRGETE